MMIVDPKKGPRVVGEPRMADTSPLGAGEPLGVPAGAKQIRFTKMNESSSLEVWVLTTM